MVKLTFHGGVKEIGGNKILLQDRDTRVFLDFGLSFNTMGKFFEEFLTPRTANGIGDFLAMGIIPDLKGIYRQDLLEMLGRKAEAPKIDGVLLSHPHADHANHISFLHKDIPVYCGETCRAVLEAVDEQSNRSIDNEVVDFRPRPINRKEEPVERIFRTFRTGRKFKVGSLEVEPVHVDHSVPGAYGFIIWTSKGAVVYTGDMRLHGAHSEMTRDFVEKAGEAKPIAMVTEGTRIDIKRTGECEDRVYSESKKKVAASKSLVIADFNFKDVDRFRTFYRIAKETGRKLVISFKHACFLERYHKDPGLKAPDSRDSGIMILKPKRGTGRYDDSDYRDSYIKSRLGYPNIVTAEEIAKNPSKYLVVLNFWYFNQLIDIKPEKALYIHSLSEPFNEEMGFSHNRMMEWVKHFNMEYFQSHCSGHMCGQDLKELIAGVSPKTLFPVHTEHPGMFRDLSMKTRMIKKGTEYSV